MFFKDHFIALFGTSTRLADAMELEHDTVWKWPKRLKGYRLAQARMAVFSHAGELGITLEARPWDELRRDPAFRGHFAPLPRRVTEG